MPTLSLKKPALQLKKPAVRKRKDPLAGMKYVGDIEADAARETSEILAAVKAADAAEKQRFEDTTDSEYHVTTVFQSRAQKEAFLSAMKTLSGVSWIEYGDKWIDGQQLAKECGIALPPSGVRFTPESSKLRDIETISNPRG